MSKTALVTGASRGIGLETTRRFILNHDDITTVVMFARDSEDFDDNVAALESELPIGRKIVPYRVDVGDRSALKKAVKQAYDQVGNIDAKTRAVFRKSYAGEPDELAKKLAEDEAIAAADTLLLTVPNQLGVDYNAHVIESVLKHVAPLMGWR